MDFTSGGDFKKKAQRNLGSMGPRKEQSKVQRKTLTKGLSTFDGTRLQKNENRVYSFWPCPAFRLGTYFQPTFYKQQSMKTFTEEPERGGKFYSIFFES